MKFFASCGKGVEYLLADEMLAFGCAQATATIAGVNCEGELPHAQRAVLWSRLASRVLWPLIDFDCADEAALYAGAMQVDWSAQLPRDASIAVDAHVSGSGITHAQFAAQRVKDAIVDQLRERDSWRPNVQLQAPDVLLNLSLRKGRAVLSIDLGGGPLHRRVWRGAQGHAPLKETVAAAVLLRGDWPKRYTEGGALFDPMCGSGTLLIEGALIAADIAPGLQRYAHRAPTLWRGFDHAQWQALSDEATARAQTGRTALRACFYGRDYDARAIQDAQANAIAAGVSDVIEWRVQDIAIGSALPANGLAVCNPPYDVRLAADPALYRALGDALKRDAPEWAASLLCGDQQLAHATGLRARKRYQIFNGPIECSLIVCDPIAVSRSTGAESKPLSEGAQMVANRLEKTMRKLKSWREREDVQCYRIYDADIPEYAAAIDVYTETDNDQRWLHVQEYAAPASIPEHTARVRLNELLAAARAVFALPKERVALKTRAVGKGGAKYGHMQFRGEFLTVREGSARLKVNVFDYLDTGLFLDHRPLRRRVHRQAEDQRFLNLFCYTGAATVQAALGGAAQTTSVDLSATYLEWLADNLRENGLGGVRHRLTQADAMDWLHQDRASYDIIFCDPPTFSNSKRAADFDVQRDHVELLRLAAARLAPQGVLYFSNNYRRFRLDTEAIAAFAAIEDITPQTIPPDFVRDPRIHRCWMLRAHTSVV